MTSKKKSKGGVSSRSKRATVKKRNATAKVSSINTSSHAVVDPCGAWLKEWLYKLRKPAFSNPNAREEISRLIRELA